MKGSETKIKSLVDEFNHKLDTTEERINIT